MHSEAQWKCALRRRIPPWTSVFRKPRCTSSTPESPEVKQILKLNVSNSRNGSPVVPDRPLLRVGVLRHSARGLGVSGTGIVFFISSKKILRAFRGAVECALRRRIPPWTSVFRKPRCTSSTPGAPESEADTKIIVSNSRNSSPVVPDRPLLRFGVLRHYPRGPGVSGTRIVFFISSKKVLRAFRGAMEMRAAPKNPAVDIGFP